ncbi:muropeptide MFS transporter AmpG, partial [Leclercia adecarboxylata]|nr:muropeptide MFS transporter AmpG [Leclercia adecarboxylata]
MATVFWAILVAFLSASQDIVIDAYRVEILRAEQQGAGAAATQFGYQLGMIASGAGALYAAQYWGWDTAYQIMALLMLVGVAVALLAPEPVIAPGASPRTILATVIAPFADFARRQGWP